MSQTISLANAAQPRKFRGNLLSWYREHQRPLPWRRTRDPYRIWISEIMLQQTRVAAVLEHYKRFLKKFPSLRQLAAADEAEVLTVWSGLGYYRRARMLHRAAKLVVSEPYSRIPSTAAQLLTLPGIGRYTANAIASIAFGEPVAVVDGNVERVLERLLRQQLSGEELWEAAQAVLDPESPGDFNQAMMELGATVCLPGVPLCQRCPVKKHCRSRDVQLEETSITEKRLRKSSALLLIRRGGAILLQQRAQDERLMPGMWELPEADDEKAGDPLLTVKHSITTTDWSVNVFSGHSLRRRSNTRWISLTHVCQLPLTGLSRKILRKLNLLS